MKQAPISNTATAICALLIGGISCSNSDNQEPDKALVAMRKSGAEQNEIRSTARNGPRDRASAKKRSASYGSKYDGYCFKAFRDNGTWTSLCIPGPAVEAMCGYWEIECSGGQEACEHLRSKQSREFPLSECLQEIDIACTFMKLDSDEPGLAMCQPTASQCVSLYNDVEVENGPAPCTSDNSVIKGWFELMVKGLEATRTSGLSAQKTQILPETIDLATPDPSTDSKKRGGNSKRTKERALRPHVPLVREDERRNVDPCRHNPNLPECLLESQRAPARRTRIDPCRANPELPECMLK